MDRKEAQRGSTPHFRSGGYDLLRVVTAAMVVLLHACTPYLYDPIPGLVWPVRDTGGFLPQLVGWSTLIVVMPIFLVMAGHFVAKGRADVGAWPFLKQRWKRLVVPMLTVGPVILAADLYIWLTGWVIDGKISVRKMQSLAFDHGEDEHLWGTGHLWFLQYLFLYSCIWIILRKPLRKRITSGSAAGLSISACASLAAVTVYCEPWVAFGFQHDWLPVPSKWLYCGAFFSIGVLLAHAPRQGPQRPAVNWGFLGVGIASVLTIVLVGLQEFRVQPGIESVRWWVAIAAATGGACTAIGAFRIAGACTFASGRKLQYLASASFWVYLLHHPFVGLSHVTLHVAFVDLSPALKMTIAFGVSVTLSLLSYEMVTRVSLGRWGALAQWVGLQDSQTTRSAVAGRESKLSAGGDAASTLHVQIGKRAA